jgi:PhzF family phenazine biosynthesis protein
MRLAIWQVDAFSAQRFGGNPAAVVPLTSWLPEATLRAIAAENNLSETAFLVRDGGEYQIRWFTPTEEVPLCGHATLASAWVVFQRLEPERQRVVFRSKSGELPVWRDAEQLVLDPQTRARSPPRSERSRASCTRAFSGWRCSSRKLRCARSLPTWLRWSRPAFTA